MVDAARVRDGLRLHAREGEAFASELAALSEAEWEAPSNCQPWTVRLLAAHVARQVDSYIGSVLNVPPHLSRPSSTFSIFSPRFFAPPRPCSSAPCIFGA